MKKTLYFSLFPFFLAFLFLMIFFLPSFLEKTPYAHAKKALLIPLLSGTQNIEEKVICSYVQELLNEGMVLDEEVAFENARKDIFCPLAPTYFLQIYSTDLTKVYGYLTYFLQEKRAHLTYIYLEEEYRKRGIARQVLQELEEKLRKEGVETISLNVFTHNLAAFRLYEKLGYEEEETYLCNGKSLSSQLKKRID